YAIAQFLSQSLLGGHSAQRATSRAVMPLCNSAVPVAPSVVIGPGFSSVNFTAPEKFPGNCCADADEEIVGSRVRQISVTNPNSWAFAKHCLVVFPWHRYR